MFSRLKKKIAEEEGIEEGAIGSKGGPGSAVQQKKPLDEGAAGGLRSHGGSSSNLSSRGSSGSLPGLPITTPNKKQVLMGIVSGCVYSGGD